LLAQDDRVGGDDHIEPIARFDAKSAPRFARDGDLMLTADLDA